MFSRLFKFLILFLVISGVAFIATTQLGVQFGTTDFWDYHGLFFLIAIALFPRLTLLLSSVPLGGLFWWLGWLFAPRILVAILATITYWNHNPILVTLSWLVAIGLESSEKSVMIYRTRRMGRTGEQYGSEREIIDVTPTRRS